MTKLQTWTMTGLATVALLIGALLATGAIGSAQEGTATPTPAPTADAGDDEATATPAPSDDSTDDDADSEDTDDDTDSEDTDSGDTDDEGRGGCAGGGKYLIKEAAAEVLGLSEEDLKDALRDGQTLAGIAESQGMSVEDFRAALEENVTAALQEQLDAGEITKEEFDESIEGLDEKLDQIINSTSGGARFSNPFGDSGFGDGA